MPILGSLLALGVAGCAPAGVPAPVAPTVDPNANEKTNAAIAELNTKLDQMKADLKKIKAALSTPPKNDELARIGMRVIQIEKLVRANYRPPRRRPPRPDDTVTYSVPVVGSAATGPRHALVTIVMGFEFA